MRQRFFRDPIAVIVDLDHQRRFLLNQANLNYPAIFSIPHGIGKDIFALPEKISPYQSKLSALGYPGQICRLFLYSPERSADEENLSYFQGSHPTFTNCNSICSSLESVNANVRRSSTRRERTSVWLDIACKLSTVIGMTPSIMASSCAF